MTKRTWNRREFLSTASQALLSTLVAGSPRMSFASSPHADLSIPELLPAKADSIILLWMAGGMAHTETFDPKPVTPYRKGMNSREILSTFPSIPTVVDGLKISQGLEGMASIMDRATLVRSVVGEDLGPVIHTRHQYHWHTGYVPPQTVIAPHLGAWIAKILGPKNPDIPAYIDIGQRLTLQGAEELKSFTTAGFLGSEHGPMAIPFPGEAQKYISPPAGMTNKRFSARYSFYKELIDNSPVGEFGSGYQKESLLRSMEGAYRLVNSPAAKAFDLSDEPEESFARYNTGRFGRGCLLARRLVEQGARFIEVSSEYIPFGNWDTHKNGHTRTVALKKQIDAPITQLVKDLEERGLLDSTLIVIASEFSRVAGRNPGASKRSTDLEVNRPELYGLHRHFIGGASTVFLGGGVPGGTVYGKTSDEFPCNAVENPVSVSEIHATIYRLLGIPADFQYEVEERPFYVTQDGKGKVISAFA